MDELPPVRQGDFQIALVIELERPGAAKLHFDSFRVTTGPNGEIIRKLALRTGKSHVSVRVKLGIADFGIAGNFTFPVRLLIALIKIDEGRRLAHRANGHRRISIDKV